MKLSDKFDDLISKQLESFGCSLGVTHLVVYLALAREGADAGFELVSQYPQLDRSLMPIDDDPELKVSSPNRRWYPIQDKDILMGVLRVEANFKDGEWSKLLDSRLKALSISLGKCFSIEIERQKNDEEINYLRNQIGVIVHQLRNPLAAIKTYARLLTKRLGADSDSLEIIQRMLVEQDQINKYVSSFEQINKPVKIPFKLGEERLLLPPNLENSKDVSIKELLIPILERAKANALLKERNWIINSNWPLWTIEGRAPQFRVVGEIVANLLENAFKYSNKKSDIGIIPINSGLLIFDNGNKIPAEEHENIFLRGFRVSASKGKDGSGVGLFLAKKLALQLGGDLTLISDFKGLDIDQRILNCKNFNIFYLHLPTESMNEQKS